MIVVLHVAIAVASILCATFGYIKPTNNNLRMSYLLIALTFTSGFFLVIAEPAHMVRTCLSGIIFLSVVTAGVMLTRRKMAAIETGTKIENA
jgi:hypothetical protein